MKKLLFLLVAGMLLTTTVQAQGILDKAKSAASSAGFDVNSLTQKLMGKLTPGLELTPQQKPDVTNIISGFLKDKSSIIGLQTSNPAQYNSKFGSLFANLKTKLGAVLTAVQLKKMLSMKPASNDPSNVLSQLFY